MANLAVVFVEGKLVVVAVVAEEDSLAVEGNLVAYHKGYCLRYPVVVFAESVLQNQFGVPLLFL